MWCISLPFMKHVGTMHRNWPWLLRMKSVDLQLAQQSHVKQLLWSSQSRHMLFKCRGSLQVVMEQWMLTFPTQSGGHSRAQERFEVCTCAAPWQGSNLTCWWRACDRMESTTTATWWSSSWDCCSSYQVFKLFALSKDRNYYWQRNLVGV